jgi:SAM-dependent methyltransferase
MKDRLLKYLVCPECRGALRLLDPVWEDEEIWQAELTCDRCQCRYPVSGGIPRFVPPAMDKVVKRNVENFGAQWQLLGQRSELNRREFLSYLDAVGPDFFTGKVVLDAGCGMGKFLYYAAQWGAADVIGVDLSNSVELASRWTRKMPNAHVIQGDLYRLPLREGFDFIYSIGVLHHLPDPEAGFRKLSKVLNRGGTLLAWVYGYEGNQLYIKFADPLRWLTCRLPLSLNKLGAQLLAGFLWTIIYAVYLPCNRIGLKRLPFNDYFLYFYELGFPFFWGTVLDKMIPSISHYYRRDEFAQWWTNFIQVRLVQRNGNSWTGVGVKA